MKPKVTFQIGKSTLNSFSIFIKLCAAYLRLNTNFAHVCEQILANVFFFAPPYYTPAEGIFFLHYRQE